MRRYFSGDVARSTLLLKLLPLSTVLFFGTLIVGANLYPRRYDWSQRVISHLISPRYNPDAYWIPALGMALAAMAALPFAGYVARRLRPLTPRLARVAGVAFGVGFVLIVSVALPQHAQPTAAMKLVHEIIARGSVIAISIGMICCSVCAFKDRVRRFGGRRSLNSVLGFSWISITLLPVCVGSVSGAVKLGEQAELAWATRFHEALRDTVLWRLAFWEWVGVVMLFVFLFLSVLLLPEEAGTSS